MTSVQKVSCLFIPNGVGNEHGTKGQVMLPKWDHSRGYGSKVRIQYHRLIAANRRKKPLAGQIMSQERGRELRKITFFNIKQNFNFAVNFAVEGGGGDCRSALEAILEVSGHVSLIIALLLVVCLDGF